MTEYVCERICERGSEADRKRKEAINEKERTDIQLETEHRE